MAKINMTHDHYITKAVMRGVVGILGVFSGFLLFPDLAHAMGPTASDIAENIVTTSNLIPALLTGLAYVLGLILCITGIFKIKEHVENPNNAPLRNGVIRLLVGGAMFALPIVTEAAYLAISGENPLMVFDNSSFTMHQFISGAMGGLMSLLKIGAPDLNGILATIITGLSRIPALISAISYVLALIFAVSGLIKIKEHVESPDQTPVRESVIRLLVAGALISLPTVFTAMTTLINGGQGAGLAGQISSALSALGWGHSGYVGLNNIHKGFCNPIDTTMGAAICQTIGHSLAAPAFLSALAYLFGLILGVWGILKVRDHVLNPPFGKDFHVL
jgi:hypothetical protein